MNSAVKVISGFLGFSMFMFGFLKFFDPFKGWYVAQVESSELPFQTLSYWAGQTGEIAVGGLFIFLVVKGKKLSSLQNTKLFTIANILTVAMMSVAVYVHLHPEVSNEDLPLKIKPPIIPMVFGLLPIINLLIHRSKPSPSDS